MGIIIDKMKKKAKLKLDNEERQLFLKESICNIGKIVEEEDRIICYVDQKSLDNNKGNKFFYKLGLNGMNQVTEGIKENVDHFKLNKPVYYIFDGIEFNSTLEFYSRFANVIFRNCTFNKNIAILWGNDITFENNKYKDHCSVYFYGDCFLTANNINKLTFINDNFVNSYDLKKYADTNFGMKIDAKLVEFINTKVNAESPATINITSEKTKIENSELKASEIYVDSPSIDFKDSSITSQKGVIIENYNCDFIGNVQAPIVIYNGIDTLDKNKESHEISKDQTELKEARKNLIDKLRNLSNNCEQLNNNKIQYIQDNLNSKTIVKTLKQR